jgi:multisubunit Na+/H+ antiporter MnhB subunit/uncharacterized MnhB-related membrane protein
MILWLFDLLLALTLVGLAWRVLAAPDLLQSVVLFIVFGLLMAVAWSRLQAFDIALAEAAIGAGLTGALLLNTLARLESSTGSTSSTSSTTSTPPAGPTSLNRAAEATQPLPRSHGEASEPAPNREDGGEASRENRLVAIPGAKPRPRAAWLSLLGLLMMLSSIMLLGAVHQITRPEEGLREYVLENMEASGVAHPVTAVLLNFRAYDTLLEMGVLLVAVIGAWSLGPLTESALPGVPPGRLLVGLVRLLAPLIVLVSGYILWAGTGQPGGAFQAGAVLSAAGVLLVVAGVVPPPTLQPVHQRVPLLIGLSFFLAVGLGVMPAGQNFLQYPPAATSTLILLIETALTLSIALTLLSLFVGGPRQAANERVEPNEPYRENGVEES